MENDRKNRQIERRRFLELGAGTALGLSGWLSGCARYEVSDRPASTKGGGNNTDTTPGPIVTPKTNDAIGVAPLRVLDPGLTGTDTIVPELVALQMRTVYELGFDGIRMTASFGDRANLLAAIPYVRIARALGIDGVVVLTQFSGVEIATALFDEKRRAEVLRFYAHVFGPAPHPAAPNVGGLGPGGAGRIAFQILNEPALFFGIPPAVYVREILAPARAILRDLDPKIIVVAAAEVGTAEGPPRMREMLEAGLETNCDRIAYHIYDRDVIRLLPPHVRGVVWITETGAATTAGHLAWVRDTYPEIQAQLIDVTRLFYFDLYDGTPGGFRLIDIRKTATGYERVAESADLYAYLAGRVAEKAAGRQMLTFDQLIPDVTAYFPTADDIAAYDALGRQ